jgi:hypothetical protein
MVPVVHGALAAQHAAAERERSRCREEEEVMTGYSSGDLGGDWQFKIVRGTFKTQKQIENVQQEQAEFGWVLIEIFDHNRIRFKRHRSEVDKDAYREGNPYLTVSKASSPGCGATMALVLAVSLGIVYWFA